MKIQEVQKAKRVLDQLCSISRSLSKIDTEDCNGTMTPRQEKRRKSLLIQAEILAGELGLMAFHQSDPRGCALYLIDKTMGRYDYSNGIALY